jgi:hypothetical protein
MRVRVRVAPAGEQLRRTGSDPGNGGAVVRYPSFRRLARLLALMLAFGIAAESALRAQDRAAAGTPPRHWWNVAAPAAAPPSGTPPGMPPNAAKAAAPGANIYRLQRDQRGEAKPLIVDADEIATWTEKVGATEYCVFLFRGLVFVQLGIIQARFDQGVAWIDLNRAKLTGKMRTEFYAEGKVRIDDGSAIHDYPRAVLDLTTRGELKINACRVPVLRKSLEKDPLVERGRAKGLGPRLLQARQPPPVPVRQTSFQTESELVLPPTVHPGKVPPAPPASPNLQPTPPLPRPPIPAPQPPQGAAAPPPTQERIARYGPPDDPSSSETVPPGPSGAAAQTIPAPAQANPAPARPASLPGDGPQPPMPDAPATGARAPDGSVPPSGPMQVPPGTPPIPPPSLPLPPPPGKPVRTTPNFQVIPRQGRFFPGKIDKGPNGETIMLFTGGVILQVRNANKIGLLDMEADRIVIWTHDEGNLLAENIQRPSGHSSNDLEVYLSGHVLIRQAPLIDPKGSERLISADEVYYDVSRNTALAINGRLQLKQMLLNDPVVATAKEIRQTSVNTFELVNVETFSSRLPSDPGLKIYMQDGVIEDDVIPLRNILGQPVFDRTTGQPVMMRQTLLDGNNSFFQLEKIPFFWLPFVSTSAQQPLGPLQNFNWGWNQLFGIQLGVSLNLYQILGLQPRPATSWLLNLDYMSYRGPGMGTLYSTAANDLFGIPAQYTNTIRAYGMYDRNYDILGGPRPMNNFRPPTTRGWWLQRIDSEQMPYGFNVMGQLSPVSDRNFIEQYYKRPWDLDPNFDTFLYVKQQQNNWAWSVIAEPRLRNWVTMTQNLPRADAWLIGQDFFHLITYSTSVNAEYAQLTLSSDYLPEVSVTDQNDSTFRGNWMQEAEIPFSLGPMRFAPYGMWNLTGYSSDLAGNPVGRSWEGAGMRASVPFTHLYKNVTSELMNVNGLNHKIVFNVNYIDAFTNFQYTNLPQLDRLNNDATNQALRDIRGYQGYLFNIPIAPGFNTTGVGGFNPNAVFFNHGLSLTQSTYYNTPQTMAIRRLLFYRDIDTLNSIDELQFQINQRLQTRRGHPGNQHIVDWMLLDLYASYFPQPNRDNYGHYWAFLQYNWLWNVGDRTALTSTGWTDPFPGGVRVWTVGAYYNRTDRTNFYLGFRYIDPLMVRAATAAITYIFSPKYAGTVSATYDFGTGESFANSLMFTRMGSDLQVSLGVSYNALQNNFNVMFNLVPNLLPANKMGGMGAMSGMGAGSSGGVLGSNF